MKIFSYEIKNENGTSVLYLSGKIDEDTPLADIFDGIESNGVLIVDMKGVTSINSYGVRCWINAITPIASLFKLIFRNIPSVIVGQMNMIFNFIPASAIVEGFYAPFYCDECDDEKEIFFTPKDISKDSYGQFKVPIVECDVCKSVLEFEDVEDEYFQFLKKFGDSYNYVDAKDAVDDKGAAKKYKIKLGIQNNTIFSEGLDKFLVSVGYDIKVENLTDSLDSLCDKTELTDDLVICGYENSRDSLREIYKIKETFPKIKIIMVTTDKLAKILVEDGIKAFYPDNIITFALEDIETSFKEISIVIDKLLGDTIFGVEKYLSKDVKIEELRVEDAHHKQRYIEHIVNYGKAVGIKPRLLLSIEAITDELIMNAIYNAPADETGKSKYEDTDRRNKVVLDEDEYATLRYGYDDEKFFVSITDTFGRLTKEKVLTYLHKCFTDPEHQVSDREGGAGLGLYMIYNLVHQFVINIRKGEMTEVIALFLVNKKKRESYNKIFHIFIE